MDKLNKQIKQLQTELRVGCLTKTERSNLRKELLKLQTEYLNQKAQINNK